jgi:hypothetical protein
MDEIAAMAVKLDVLRADLENVADDHITYTALQREAFDEAANLVRVAVSRLRQYLNGDIT